MQPRRWMIISYGIVLLLLSAALLPMVSAQDSQPTPTPIPVDTGDDGESGVPTLPDISVPTVVGDPDVSAPESTEAPDATSAEDSTAPDMPAGDVCPVGVQDAFTATEILCDGLASGEVCIGNGSIAPIFGADVAGVNFGQAGERVRLTSLDQLTLTSSATAWPVVRGSVELNTTDGAAAANAALVMIGDVTLSDAGRVASGGAQDATVIAQRGMNVRRAPATDGTVVWQLQPGEQIITTGITPDRVWIRIVIPNRFQGIGWVYAPYLEVTGGTDALPVVTVDSPPLELSAPDFGPMQSVELLSATAPDDCPDVPTSGLLLQSPDGIPDAVRFEVNGVELQVSGTVFISAQAGRALTVDVLEGQTSVIVGDGSESATAGNRVTVALDSNLAATSAPQAAPVSDARLALLPLRLLPRQFVLGSLDTDDAGNEGGFVEPTAPAGFGTPSPTQAPETCTLTAFDEVRNVRSGPATVYPVLRVLQVGESTTGVGQLTGVELNLTWYQTPDGGFVRIDTVQTTGDCGALPLVDAPPLPEPTVEPTPEVTISLSSSQLGDVACPAGQVTGSTTSDGNDFSVQIGGTWTVGAETTIVFTVQGNSLRPEFGDLIQLQGEDGTFIAGSGEDRSLRISFDENRTFVARFSAANGELVVMSATCEGGSAG